jgi:hypothetical protein
MEACPINPQTEFLMTGVKLKSNFANLINDFS